MIIVLKPHSTEEQVGEVTTVLRDRGYGVHLSRGVERTIVGAIGALDQEKKELQEQFQAYEFVENVLLISKPYKLVGRDFHPDGTVVTVRGVRIGGEALTVMAGPCTVESAEQLFETAREVKARGATMLRGGAYKPSTSPYSFHGLRESGLQLLAEAREMTGLPIITEVLDTRDVELVGRTADIFQIGTRNMTNFELLREVGRTTIPVMLKRGMSSTIEEWMQAAEYILSEGNRQVLLCERGIRTFEPMTRFTFDINAIPLVKELSHLPIIADPSHGTGRAHLVTAVAKGAVAAGADGLMVEVHPDPARSIKDAAQALSFGRFGHLMREIEPVASAVGRGLASTVV